MLPCHHKVISGQVEITRRLKVCFARLGQVSGPTVQGAASPLLSEQCPGYPGKMSAQPLSKPPIIPGVCFCHGRPSDGQPNLSSG